MNNDRSHGAGSTPPLDGDRAAWAAYWQLQGPSWRTEPEIGTDRRDELSRRRTILPDVPSGRYPFGGMVLSRADVEWLLATLENGRGPVEWLVVGDKDREGLDLRGADLTGVDLSRLHLARFRGSLDDAEWLSATPEQRDKAVVKLSGTDLSGARLQGALLIGINMERGSLAGAILDHAHLQGSSYLDVSFEGASVRWARLEGANFRRQYGFVAGTGVGMTHTAGNLRGASLAGAHLEGASLSFALLQSTDLTGAFLDGAYLPDVQLEGSNLRGASLSGADLRGAHLQGTCLSGARLQGKLVSIADFTRIRPWATRFLAALPPADLRRVTCDADTRLHAAALGDRVYGAVALADVSWGGANLTVIDWSRVDRIGDDRAMEEKHDRSGAAKPWEQRVRECRDAARGNRQLATALDAQGLEDNAARFVYWARVAHRNLLARQLSHLPTERRRTGVLGDWLFSWFLFLLAGYGYRLRRSIAVYLAVNLGFGVLYWTMARVPLSEAFFVSLAAFHGRGFQPDQFHPGQAATYISGIEAFVGLVIEATFIATLTRRFFGR